MKSAQDMLLPKLEGKLDDWIIKKDEAWQNNQIHWGFWCAVILLNTQQRAHLNALRHGLAVSILFNVVLLAVLLVSIGGR